MAEHRAVLRLDLTVALAALVLGLFVAWAVTYAELRTAQQHLRRTDRAIVHVKQDQLALLAQQGRELKLIGQVVGVVELVQKNLKPTRVTRTLALSKRRR